MSAGISFEPVPEPPEQNRLFIIIAIGLVGMLVLGLLGIGGYVVFSRSRKPTQAQGAGQATPVVLMTTSTPTVMATDTPGATETSAVKLTSTPVVLLPSPTPMVVVIGGSPTGVTSMAAVKPAATSASGFFKAETPAAGKATVIVITTAPQAPAAGNATVVVITAPAQAAAGGAVGTVAPQAVPVQPAGGEAPPNTGFGLGALGLGAGLAALAFLARRLRLS